ncbi:flagellin [Phyllobacterium sp. 21LDTY02-6]|uniref:flagellin N-terminal helical domain-containing protein n=1 Tax=unclassified Phyllobacterium TaxID=2638441 RepID=UPI002021332E|nr:MULTISPECIES: flagellin [unclassified Phyllobacterium]MCO4315657.1 flagellin [Phyllobacterium sp. 21LDTY02-6]MCX8280931.1 flagellin [Phyllobacterium sp. 0TCS1.6C]MCX8295797.1 flagellin [Phyllobacterium sp. 0TCS1.6A]
MSSILTNASAMTALQTLSATNQSLATTQNRIATGMKVSEASDNAAYWSIATTMRSDNKANSVIKEALGLGGGKVDTAYTAIKSAVSVVDQIKEKVLSSKNASADDRAKIQTEIEKLQAQLTDNIGGASYAGSNLLQTDSAPAAGGATKLSIISSYNRDAAGAITTGAIEVDFASIRLIDTNAANAGLLDKEFAVGAGNVSVLTLDVTTAGLTDVDFNAMLGGVEAAAKGLANGAAELGATKTRIDLQTSFIGALSDAVDRGIGALVDADMNKESARLSALQVQQQLGVQALSIANSGNQSILSLFRG